MTAIWKQFSRLVLWWNVVTRVSGVLLKITWWAGWLTSDLVNRTFGERYTEGYLGGCRKVQSVTSEDDHLVARFINGSSLGRFKVPDDQRHLRRCVEFDWRWGVLTLISDWIWQGVLMLITETFVWSFVRCRVTTFMASVWVSYTENICTSELLS